MLGKQMVWVQIMTEDGAVTDQNYANPSNEASLYDQLHLSHRE